MTGQLLSPSESHAFQSFLSSIDYPDSHVSQEWPVYTPAEHSADEPSRARSKEALTKATKDLMALDATQMQPQSQSHQQFDYAQRQRRADQLYDHEFRHNQSPFQNRSDLPGLTYLKQPQSRSLSQLSQGSYSNRRQALGITIAPSRTIASPPPSAPTSYTPHHQLQFSHNQSSHRSASVTKHTISHEQFGRSSAHKRPRLSPSASASPSSTSSLLLPLPHLPQPHHQSVSPPLQYTTLHTHKPTLLSPSQKKANHIQSEQKRRANIRRGYEALCETVPSLRDAIKEEAAMASASGNGDMRSYAGARGRGKRGRGRGKPEEGEKVDGRAGPRSENVVLSKTIEYINDLLSERSTLLTRLNRAKDALPPGQPASTGRHPVPLWEREWKGGEGRSDGGEEEEEDYESS